MQHLHHIHSFKDTSSEVEQYNNNLGGKIGNSSSGISKFETTARFSKQKIKMHIIPEKKNGVFPVKY